jgi:hypothetical protein
MTGSLPQELVLHQVLVPALHIVDSVLVDLDPTLDQDRISGLVAMAFVERVNAVAEQ